MGGGPRAAPHLPSPCVSAEAAVRGVRQAQAEDVAQVDVEQLEKVLPQLVCRVPGMGCTHGWRGARPTLRSAPPQLLDF